jgi:hypothetical protein
MSRNDVYMTNRVSATVNADVSIDFQPVDVAPILEGWALEEVESLLSSTADALDELAMQASEVALGDAVISFKRADLEAYVAERRERVSP